MSAPRAPEPNLNRQSGAELRTSRISAGIQGTGVALALGGGFARGFAHLGVLEVLEQEHIAVSAIAGTSIGGLLGAAYADGFSIRELCDLGRQVRMRDFIRFHRSSHSTPRIDRIGQFVRECFHAGRVEELCIPTAIVTTDIDTCEAYVFTQGPLEVAIRATCAFPGLFQPIRHAGRLLADGCIAAPVPTAVAARMSALCVLGVAVGPNTKNTSCSVDSSRRRTPAVRPSRPEQGSLAALRNARRLAPPGAGTRTSFWNRMSTKFIGTILHAWTRRTRPAWKPCGACSPVCGNCWTADLPRCARTNLPAWSAARWRYEHVSPVANARWHVGDGVGTLQ